MVIAKDLMNELHIDTSEIEENTIQSIIDSAQAIVCDGISSELTVDDLERNSPVLFDLAVKSLTTSLYYDRELVNGTSKGFQMIMVHLASEVALGGLKHED